MNIKHALTLTPYTHPPFFNRKNDQPFCLSIRNAQVRLSLSSSHSFHLTIPREPNVSRRHKSNFGHRKDSNNHSSYSLQHGRIEHLVMRLAISLVFIPSVWPFYHKSVLIHSYVDSLTFGLVVDVLYENQLNVIKTTFNMYETCKNIAFFTSKFYIQNFSMN